VSKKHHRKQVDKARAKRRQQQAFARKQRRQKVVIIVMVVLMVLSLVAVGLGALFADDGTPSPEVDPVDDTEPEAFDDPAAADGPCPPAGDDVPTPTQEPYEEPPTFDVDPDATYRVRLDTTCGEIVVELDTEGAPRTAENFLALADDGYYDGTPFHRIALGFVAQGGDPTGTGTGCVDPACEVRLPGYEFEDELDTAEALPEADGAPGAVEYPRGTLAMANAGPDTQGSQFFVVQADPGYPFPPAYTIFGEVVEGMEVVDDIVAGPVDGDRAIDPVRIRAATIERS
jgi:cyclophilin family peptidyl-prolyl cis-trans isomerase